ncbi:MAG: NifB/NifX family molybdenum-iron cluster-binding protein [Gammaproteobacteria bacterium]|nr:NifB/NifX family molybdenum-iron cluster-binding protein [Gammaproteobacteria bacterium]
MALERRLKLMITGTEAVEMAMALKVAFATSDMQYVDQHFGAAEAFAVYAVNPEHAGLAEAVQFGRKPMDGNEEKLAAKIDALNGCIAVYCQAAGASAVNQLRSRGIQAIKVSAGSEIQALIEALQDELRQGPSAWLGRAIAQQKSRDAGRFDDMEQEGWVE